VPGADSFFGAWSLLRFARKTSKSRLKGGFFTLQTAKAACKSWFLRHKGMQKPASATGSQGRRYFLVFNF
jgi:hypothetical protein